MEDSGACCLFGVMDMSLCLGLKVHVSDLLEKSTQSLHMTPQALNHKPWNLMSPKS